MPISVIDHAASPRFAPPAYGMYGDGSDVTPAWLRLLGDVAAAGGTATVAFPAGTYRLGPHQPVAGLHSLTLVGAGAGQTIITATAGAIDYTRPDATVAVGAYQCSPLRFQSLTRLDIRDLTVDAAATGALAATEPYLTILYKDAAGVLGAEVGATTLGVTDASTAPIGTELIFGDIDAETSATFLPYGAYCVSTVTGVSDPRHVTVSPALTFPLTPSGPRDSTFAVSRATALGGACIDARDIGHLSLRGVELTGALRYGLYMERVAHLSTAPDLWVHDIGMQGGFGHTTEYPWTGVGGWCGGVCGYDVATADLDGGLIEDSPGQGIYFYTNPKRRDFGAHPPDALDIRLRGVVVRRHGFFSHYTSTGSGIGIVCTRSAAPPPAGSDVRAKRVLIQGCQITDTQDGPIWVMAQEGLVEIVDNQIDTGYGPSIALGAGRYRVSGNVLKNSGQGGIQVIASGFADYNVDKGLDVPDGDISHNIIDGSAANAISVGTFGAGHPPHSARRTVIAHNVAREIASDGVFLQDVDGSILLDGNILRRTNLVTLAAATLTVASPTAPNAATGRVFYTLTVASGALSFIPSTYLTLTDAVAGVSGSLLIAEIPDDQHLTIDTQPTGGSGAGGAFVVGSTLTGRFPGLGAIRIQGRLPFATTLSATTATSPATVTVADIGAVGNGLTLYDRVRFGTDPAVYQIWGIAGTVTPFVLTLDRAWDATPPANGTAVYLNDVYAARNIQIRGGMIGAADEETPSTTDGIALVRTGGLVTIDGVTISRVRQGGIYAEDSQPRNGTIASAIRDCLFNDLGLDGLATANSRKAAVYLVANVANSTATNGGWWIERNRLVDDQPAAGPRPAQYGVVVSGPYVDGGKARNNDWGFADTAAWGLAGSNPGTFTSWTREDNVSPWHQPNQDDLELIEEFPGGEATATGRVGTHGWRWGGTGNVALVSPGGATPSNTIGGLQLNTGTVATNFMWAGLGTSGATAPLLFDAGMGWDVAYVFRALSVGAAADYRLGVLKDANVNPPTDGVYLEKLAADTNWFFVVNTGGAITRHDSGVAAFPGGTFVWTQVRIRRFLRGWNVTVPIVVVACWLGNVGGANHGQFEFTTGFPASGTGLAPAVQVATADAAAKSLQIDRAAVRVHGLARA